MSLDKTHLIPARLLWCGREKQASGASPESALRPAARRGQSAFVCCGCARAPVCGNSSRAVIALAASRMPVAAAGTVRLAANRGAGCSGGHGHTAGTSPGNPRQVGAGAAGGLEPKRGRVADAKAAGNDRPGWSLRFTEPASLINRPGLGLEHGATQFSARGLPALSNQLPGLGGDQLPFRRAGAEYWPGPADSGRTVACAEALKRELRFRSEKRFRPARSPDISGLRPVGWGS
jgi:hypothetical protein